MTMTHKILAAHAGKEALSLNSMDIVSELVRWHFEKTL